MAKRRLKKALKEGTVEEFIQKYKEHLSEIQKEKIRAIAEFRDDWLKAKRAIDYEKYNEEAIEIFLDLGENS